MTFEAQDRRAGATIATMDSVTFAFGTLPVIDPFCLEIRTGENTAIMAPSGAGKSTLIRLLLKLVLPQTGIVGLQVDKRSVGVVFQDHNLFPWLSVSENLNALNRSRAPYHDDDLLNAFGLAAFVNYYPRALSGGMRQKVALCRLLLQRPKLYVVDEGLSNLDELTRFQVCDLLRARVKSDAAAMVFVTHNLLDALHVADRILFCSPRPLRHIHEIISPLPTDRTADIRFTERFRTLAEDVRRWIV